MTHPEQPGDSESAEHHEEPQPATSGAQESADQDDTGTTEAPSPGKKPRTRMWVGIGAAAAVVIAALLVTGLAAPAWMLGGNTMNAQATLQRYTTALNSRDAGTMASLSCRHPGRKQQQQAVQQLSKLRIHAAVTKPAAEHNNTAQGTVRVTAFLKGKQRSQSGPVQLKKVHNRWCVA